MSQNITVVSNFRTPERSIKLIDAVLEMVNAKRQSNLSKIYTDRLRDFLFYFARGQEDRPVNSFTCHEIGGWLGKRTVCPRTRKSDLGRLSALFDFCWRREWCQDNPCRRVERQRVVPQIPRIFTVEEAKRLLEFTREQIPNMLGYLVLGLFAGVRPHELLALEWGNVDLNRAMVTIDAAASKVNRRRVVELEAAAVAWLKVCDAEQPLIPGLQVVLYRRHTLAGVLGGVKWPQDVLRHTAASYLLALHQDAGKVAYGLGNSPKILMSHYWKLTTKEDAERFFALRPEN